MSAEYLRLPDLVHLAAVQEQQHDEDRVGHGVGPQVDPQPWGEVYGVGEGLQVLALGPAVLLDGDGHGAADGLGDGRHLPEPEHGRIHIDGGQVDL